MDRIICNECGTEMPDGSEKCEWCGAKLDGQNKRIPGETKKAQGAGETKKNAQADVEKNTITESMPIASLLIKKGRDMYTKGNVMKNFLWIGLGAIALILLCVSFAEESFVIAVSCLLLAFPSGFVNFLMLLAYASTIVGVVGIRLYRLGLHYMGLGQIAENTQNSKKR